jgi:dihydrofolate synthase/folylpolyglutamate synthase
MGRAAVENPRRTEKRKSSLKKKDGAPQIRTFRSAVNYLDSLVNYERVLRRQYHEKNFNLARMSRILSALDNPHRQYLTAHIAGTKGKGSTATMLAAMLHGCGRKVGLYTSPHVVNIRERIAVGSEEISERAFARAVASVVAVLAKARVPEPTYYEVLTAAAFKYFADCGVEVAVIETGMGGRLDATNVVSPTVIGLTSISLDHQHQLGDTLTAIAQEKAGIIKKGVPVVSATQDPEVREVIRSTAEEMEAPLQFSDQDYDFSYRFEFSRAAGRHARICLTTANSRFEHLHVPLFGEHQAMNCGLALTMLDILKASGVTIDDQAAMSGLAKVKLVGRMEMIREEPRLLVDGAHNADSIDALMRAIGQHITYDSMIVIFGCQKDKDIRGMIKRLQLGADKLILVGTPSPRTADPADLAAEYLEQTGRAAQVATSLEDAMEIATAAVTREDLICITGSFYLVGQAKRLLGTNGAAASVAAVDA